MKRYKLGLEAKLLLLLIAIASLPLIVDNFVWLTISRTQEINRATTEVSNVSQEADNDIKSFFTTKVIGLMIHSQTDAVRIQNTPQAGVELRDYLRQDQDIIDLILLNTNGQQIAHVTPTRVYDQTQLTNDSNSPEFKVTTFVGGEQYISPVFKSSANQPLVKIAVPVITSENITSLQHLTTSSFGTARKKGEINGVLIATVQIASLWDTLNALKIGKTGYVFIIDDKGNVLDHPNKQIESQTQK